MKKWTVAFFTALAAAAAYPAAASAGVAPTEPPFGALQRQGVKFFARYSVVDDSAWKVLVSQTGGEDLLTVQDERTARVLLSASGNSERFLSAEAVQVRTRSEPFLVTRWTKGVHGQEVRIYDPRASEERRLVYSKASSWTISYREVDGRLKISGRADERPGATEGGFEVSWP